jgi:hypothetical protein
MAYYRDSFTFFYAFCEDVSFIITFIKAGGQKWADHVVGMNQQRPVKRIPNAKLVGSGERGGRRCSSSGRKEPEDSQE